MLRTLTTTLALTAVAAATTTLVLGSPAGAADDHFVLNAQLTGEQEDGAGDPDGKAKGQLKVNVATGEICYKIRARDVEELTGGHIHEKAAGSNVGPVVVPFTKTGPTTFEGCTKMTEQTRAVALGLRDEPGEYYLNVHNMPYMGGALRADLG